MKNRILVKTLWFWSKNLLVIHTILFLFAFLLFLSGCGTFSAASSSKIDVGDSSDAGVNNSSINSNSADTGTENTKEIAQTSDSDESATPTESNSSSETITETTEAVLTVIVYYANADVSALSGEERIVRSSYKYLEAFLELMKPPISPDLVRLVPETVKVNKLSVTNGNVDLDLSKNLIDDRFKSDLMDILLVHSIVNTLTEFKEINTITFYIDGKKGTTIGEADISVPVFRDESYIQKN